MNWQQLFPWWLHCLSSLHFHSQYPPSKIQLFVRFIQSPQYWSNRLTGSSYGICLAKLFENYEFRMGASDSVACGRGGSRRCPNTARGSARRVGGSTWRHIERSRARIRIKRAGCKLTGTFRYPFRSFGAKPLFLTNETLPRAKSYKSNRPSEPSFKGLWHEENTKFLTGRNSRRATNGLPF